MVLQFTILCFHSSNSQMRWVSHFKRAFQSIQQIHKYVDTTLLDDTQILALLNMVLPDLRRSTSTTLLLSSPSPGPFRPKFVSTFLEIIQGFTCLLKRSISSMRGFRRYYNKVDILVLCADAVPLIIFLTNVTNVTMMHSEVHWLWHRQFADGCKWKYQHYRQESTYAYLTILWFLCMFLIFSILSYEKSFNL